MRTHLATALILGGFIALLWSIGLGPQAAVSLAQVQPPPRPTLTAAPPTAIPPTAPAATPRPRSDDDDDDSATPTAIPTLTPDVVATPTAEPAATPSPTAPPSPTNVAPAAPPQLPRTGGGATARWSMALLGLALLALGLRLFRAAGDRR